MDWAKLLIGVLGAIVGAVATVMVPYLIERRQTRRARNDRQEEAISRLREDSRKVIERLMTSIPLVVAGEVDAKSERDVVAASLEHMTWAAYRGLQWHSEAANDARQAFAKFGGEVYEILQEFEVVQRGRSILHDKTLARYEREKKDSLTRMLGSAQVTRTGLRDALKREAIGLNLAFIGENGFDPAVNNSWATRLQTSLRRLMRSMFRRGDDGR